MKREDFLTRRPGMIGEEKFRQYAVLVPLINISGVTYLIFEKRSNKLKRQPGEICFPGGKLEENETMQECAVRETEEELLIFRTRPTQNVTDTRELIGSRFLSWLAGWDRDAGTGGECAHCFGE